MAESAKLDLPAAYVIASADAADDNVPQNTVVQRITDQFAVVVVLEATDERGQEANDLLHDIRDELWRALIGWKPAPEYTPLEYGKGALLHISRARVVYQMTFVAASQLGRKLPHEPAETWAELVADGLVPFEGRLSTWTASIRRIPTCASPARMGALKSNSQEAQHHDPAHHSGTGPGPCSA